jgi:hypothetical protein
MPIGTDLRRAGNAALLLFALWAGAARADERPGPVGSLLVTGAPSGRQVWVEGKYAGQIPVQVDSLPPGKISVEIGGTPEERRWRPATRIRAIVREGRIDTLRVGRAGTDGTSPSAESESIPPGGGEYLEPESMPMPRSAVLLPTAAVALGVAGFWCRHAADESYRDYHATLDPRAMQRHLDSAARLDRAAVACWLGAEACLFGAAWIWLRAGPDLPIRASRHQGSIRVGWEISTGDASTKEAPR